MAYPDTTLSGYTQDPDFGGEPASEFGQPAFKWLNSVIQFIENLLLTWLLVPRKVIDVTSQNSAVAGDVAVYLPDSFVTNRGYHVTKYSSPASSALIAGIYAEPLSAGARGKVITHGVVPFNITGLGIDSVSRVVGINPSTGRIRVAQVGDIILGNSDIQGNVFLTQFGYPAV